MRAAAVQLNSGADKAANIAAAGRLIREAAGAGAELVVLPEKFNLIGPPEVLRAGAEPLDGPTGGWARDLSRELSIWLVAGSFAELVEEDSLLRNTSVLTGPDGQIESVYRKIHMFDVDIAGKAYRESETESAGDEIVLGEADGLSLGMSICYDLRFPELYRILAVRGAQAFALPAAFTVPTGKAHWDILVRARAIENQAFVIAAGQVGFHPGGYESFGHSMIVDPWGRVLTQVESGDGVALADIDLAQEQRIRAELPSLANRKPRSYLWPAVAGVAA